VIDRAINREFIGRLLMSNLNKIKSSQSAVDAGAGLAVAKAEEESRRRFSGLPRVVLIFVQVALIAVIVWSFHLESSSLRRIVYLAAGGFLVNHLMPRQYRLAFFALFSLAITYWVVGGSASHAITDVALAVPRTAALLLLGGTMIALCRLRIGFWKRVGLLLVVGSLAALFRAGIWPSGNLAGIWPIFAGMFMFRVMIYLYDVSTSPKPPSISQSFSYFFLIPNVSVLLFPLIDFRTFCSKYYDEEALVIYQRGVKWMTRGLIHLLLYRLIDRQWGLTIADVANGTDLIRYVISNSFLYLKVSGIFHFCIGLLLLFGFNLPETNHRYFLASSFTDYWRRVNTYWRMFIMKVFYYPAFFRLKKLGQLPALILATLWCFAVTWALHLYQTWWLTGTAAFSVPDILFWTILAFLVLANSIWELKKGRLRKLTTSRFSARDAFGLVARTMGTFALISLLWSLWSAPNLGQWVFALSLADIHTLAWGSVALGVVAIATVLFEAPSLFRVKSAAVGASGTAKAQPAFWREWSGTFASLVILCGLGYFLQHTSQDRFESFRRALMQSEMVPRDRFARQGRGYYEGLTEINWANRQLWETLRREEFPFMPQHQVKDYRWNELLPNLRGIFGEVDFQTNRWGMHDKDYELQKPVGTRRIAVLGSSNVEGFGVLAEEGFESLIETRLAGENAKDGRFQLLNFAIGGCGPLGQSTVMEKSVVKFSPDVVLLVTHMKDLSWMNRDARGGAREKVPDNYEFIQQVLLKTEVDENLTEKTASQRLRPYEGQMLEFAFQQIVQRSHAINALPVCAVIPLAIELPLPKAQVAEVLARAKAAGFIVLDLTEVFDGKAPKQLKLPDSGGHWNSKAHALIAARLYDQLTTNPEINLLGSEPRAPAGPTVPAVGSSH